MLRGNPDEPLVERRAGDGRLDILESVGVGLCLLDAHDIVIRANEEWLRMSGVSRAYALGRSIWDLFPEASAEIRSRYEQARAGSLSLPLQCNHLRGQQVWYEGRLSPVPLPTGTGLLITAVDVTERKREADARRRSEQRARVMQRELFFSEERLRRSFENAAIGVSMTCPDGSLMDANPAFCGIVGYALEELLGRSYTVFVHPEDCAAYAAMIERLVGGDRADCVIETRCVHKDGSIVCVRMSVSLARGSSQGSQWLIGLVEDVTERKAAEQALRQSEERLRIALEAACAGAFDWNMELNHVVWSDGIYALLGLTPHSTTPSYELWRRFIHPADLQRVEHAVEQAVRQRERCIVEFRMIGADGVERWIQGQAIVIARPQRQTRMVGALVDITSLKKAEEALRSADHRKDEFLAALAHELRNPLAPIRAAVQILGSPSLSPEQLEWVRRVIDRQTTHAAYLIDDLLDLARITHGKLEIRKSQVDLSSIMSSAVEAARPLIDAKSHRLAMEVPPQPLTIRVDAVRLAQVITNLLNNSAKFTEIGGRIRLTALAGPSEVSISVADNGIGLTPADCELIFEKFAQVRRSADSQDTGLGLGLALVKGIVGLHGGTVEVRSEGIGKGSEFTVRIPLDIADLPPAGDPAPQAAYPSRTRMVLVVDDNRDAADANAMLLQISGHRVLIAHSGEEAIQLAEANHPDVVLLDIGMPGLNGYEIAARLRAQSWSQETCLIALTGFAQPEDKRRAAAAGFDYHLTKPVPPAEIVSLVTTGRRGSPG